MSLLSIPELPSRVDELERRLAALEGRPPILPDTIAVPNVYNINEKGETEKEGGGASGLEPFVCNFENEEELENWEQAIGPGEGNEVIATPLAQLGKPTGKGFQILESFESGYLDLLFRPYRDEEGRGRCIDSIQLLKYTAKITAKGRNSERWGPYASYAKLAGGKRLARHCVAEGLGGSGGISSMQLAVLWLSGGAQQLSGHGSVSFEAAAEVKFPATFYILGIYLGGVASVSVWSTDPLAATTAVDTSPVNSKITNAAMGPGTKGENLEQTGLLAGTGADIGFGIKSPKEGDLINQYKVIPLSWR